MFSLLRDVFSYVGVRISSVGLRRDRCRGWTYGFASLEGEGLLVRLTILTQSYPKPHLLPHGLLPPQPQHLASGDLPVAEGIASREPPVLEVLALHEVPPVPEGLALHEVPPVPEGLALHEVPPVPEPPLVSELVSSFSLSDTTVHIQYIYEKMNEKIIA